MADTTAAPAKPAPAPASAPAPSAAADAAKAAQDAAAAAEIAAQKAESHAGNWMQHHVPLVLGIIGVFALVVVLAIVIHH
jgi:hypothetical protein